MCAGSDSSGAGCDGGNSDGGTVPYVLIGRVESLPGMRNVRVTIRDVPRDGETIEQAGERVARLVNERIHLLTMRRSTESAPQRSLDRLSGSA
jgi:hypothetical protein